VISITAITGLERPCQWLQVFSEFSSILGLSSPQATAPSLSDEKRATLAGKERKKEREGERERRKMGERG
jgi:hypothetical protein